MAKKIIKICLKICVFLHIPKSINISYEEAKKQLEKAYEIKQYDLSCAVKNINDYKYDLSIIVPVYNASNYIKQCVESLLNQKTKYSYEVICINDGSTDDSLEILENISDRKLKIISQNNQGISATRNKGLNSSLGKYVGFVDNDDYVCEDYVEKLLNVAYENDADYVRSGYEIFDEANNKTIERVSDNDFVCRDLNNKNDIDSFGNHGYMWSGIYKRSIWKGFCFPNGYWYEDMVKGIYLYSKCKVMVNLHDIIYFKRKHKNNAADVLWKKQDIKCLDQLFLACELIDLRDETNLISECAVLNEFGSYLYKRINYLPEEIKKYAFIIACDKYVNNYNTAFRKDDFKFFNIQKALLSKDYGLWKLLGKYNRY